MTVFCANMILRVTKLTRRELFKATALPLAAAVVKAKPARRHIIVVGAGAFGGWTALHLLRSGARVTLIDAWGPGNARASSGGETRVIRSIYGGDRDYIQWVARSFALWREFPQIYQRTGALWMFAGDDSYAKSSLPLIATRIDQLSLDTAHKRYPQIDFAGVGSVYVEHEAGYLFARRGCQVVQEAFVRAGGTFRLEQTPSPVNVRDMSKRADAVVFACGPWLGKMLPDFVGNAVAPSRQEVFFFGTEGGDRRFLDFPVWVDFSDRVFYGIPGNEYRGFKVADDTRGDAVDPTTLDRRPSAEGLARARAKLAARFPALANAPLLEARVCQYENSPDGHFIIDRHPDASNVFVAGGGSGHGYKLGPALGEYVSDVVLGKKKLMERFRLSAERKQKAPTTQMEHA
jgi:glycine/D-amino acid oxidase-like deaminating enzyme